MQIIQRRKIYYIISLLLIIPGIISLFMQGLNLGIDYKGGSILHVRISAETSVKEVREAVSGLEFGNPEVQKSNDEFYIRTIELNQEQTKDLIQILTNKFERVEFLSAESVGAV
ncbi:MAG: protein translocase subunit SecF, partial [Syntrophomonadaceae bacterium]|nr:protein translocase subunit SecF [Syntrophomonadaceae bacterium]